MEWIFEEMREAHETKYYRDWSDDVRAVRKRRKRW